MKRGWSATFVLACAGVLSAAEPRRPSLYEQVERDRDRGAGRIVGDAEWEVDRFQERRNESLGSVRPRSRFERFEEERDRDARIDARLRAQQRAQRDAVRPREASTPLGQAAASGAAVGTSPLAAVVVREQRELAEARDTRDRSLRAVDASEARALRSLRRRLTREGTPDQYESRRQELAPQFGALRARHREAYDVVRQRIRGDTPPANPSKKP